MRAHDGAVDHGVFVVGIGREMLEDPLPNAGFGPAVVAAVHVLPVAEPLGQVAPGDACPVSVEHSFHEQAVIGRGDPNRAFSSRQDLFDPIPLVVTKPITAHWSASEADRLRIEEHAAPESPIASPTADPGPVLHDGRTLQRRAYFPN